MHSLVRAVVLLACLSCSTARDPSEAVYTGKPAELHVRLQGQKVSAGENLTAVISINNHGQPPHRLDFGTGCQFTWVITTPDSVTLTTRCLICTQAPTFIILAGTLFTTSIVVPTRRLCELPWPFKDDVVPAGQYTLTVYAIGYEDQLATEPVPFEIVEDSGK